MTLSFLGHRGSYLDLAATRFDPSAHRAPCANARHVVSAVTTGQAMAGLLPLTLPSGNLATAVLDRIASSAVSIVAELELTASTALMSATTRDGAAVRVVAAPWETLYRCTGFLGRQPDLFLHMTPDPLTWLAARSTGGDALLAPVPAADDLGLTILETELDDDPTVPIRCAVVATDEGRTQLALPSATTSLVVFTVENRSGALHRALSVFAVRDVDLSSLTLRREPTGPLGSCTFYATAHAAAREPRLERAVEHLREFATSVRVLGSFATWPDPARKRAGVAPGFEWALPSGRGDL